MRTLLLFMVALIGTAGRAAPLDIWCSIPPLMSVAREIGGARVAVSCFLTGSRDPHTFSPSPRTVARARNADLFLTVGMPFELMVQDKLSALNPGLKTLNAAKNIKHNGDMHVWLSLPLLSQMAGELEKTLSRLDPEGRETYRHNLQRYQAVLMGIHRELEKRLAPLKGTVFYVYHPAFSHFAADYGLRQEAVELDGKTPSPKQLLSLIRRAREENVRVIFVQPQFDRRPAQIIAKRIGGRVVELNQLDENPVEVIQKTAMEIEHAVRRP